MTAAMTQVPVPTAIEDFHKWLVNNKKRDVELKNEIINIKISQISQ
jgi:hypothetical protein